MNDTEKLSKIIDVLREMVKRDKDKDVDEAYNGDSIYSKYGGNIDDAFNGGIDYGYNEAACYLISVLEKLGEKV